MGDGQVPILGYVQRLGGLGPVRWGLGWAVHWYRRFLYNEAGGREGSGCGGNTQLQGGREQ